MKPSFSKNWYHYIFYVVTIAWLALITLGEILVPEENQNLNQGCHTWQEDWVLIKDGEEIPVKMPGQYDIPKGETMVLESTVPWDVNSGDIVTLRASQQSVRVYVDGKLKTEYDTKEERPFGKNSMSRYIFFPLGSGECGKTIRLEITSDSIYSGLLNTMYYGSESSVISHLIKNNIVEVVTAIFILFMAIFGIAICIIIKTGLGKDVPLLYLCICLILASGWILSEAQLRQFFFPNATLIGINAFYMIIFTPYAAALYFDHLQEGRYHKYYVVIEMAFLVDFVLVSVLQVLEIMDLLESMYITHSVTIMSIVFAVGTIILDVKSGAVKKYKDAAFGLVIFLFCGVLEIVFTYVLSFHGSGVMLSVGLVLLLIFATITTAKDIFEEDRDKQRAILAGEAKSEFLTRMSHEIRTPINSILGMNEMILRENHDEAINEYAGNVERAGQMLLSLVNDILDLSKIESGKLELFEKPYSVALMLQDIHNMFEERIAAKGLQFEYEVDPHFPMELVGDEIRIKQIVANLMSNAVKYTKKGFVSLSASGFVDENGNYMLRVRVADSGQGIKEEDMDMLFQRFTRLEEKRNESIQGTGLGLSIVKELVEVMNGRIEVNSQYGVGAEFVVEIPQKVFDLTPIGDIKNYRSAQPASKFHERLVANNVRILSVDDNEMNHAVLLALLKRTGIEVDVANSGEECLELCEKHRYDLILMDHMMPNMDGIETLHAIRKGNSMNKKTKAVAVTANAIPGVREVYLEAGFVDYLTKPLDYGQLEKVLIAQLNVGKISLRAKEEDEQEEKIDEKIGLSYCADDDDFYLEMLQMYLAQSVEHRESLAKYLAEEDWDNYAIKVHTIKSTSKSIGAMGLFERAKEQEARTKDRDIEFVKADYESFYKLYEKVLEQVSSIIATREAGK